MTNNTVSKYANLKQISELDRLAMEEFGLDILQMMEIAGNKFALIVRNYLGNLGGKKILILAGVGNNGGDGLSCSRYLVNWGASVDVVLAREDLKQPAKHHKDTLEKMEIYPKVATERLPKADLIVDALLGYNQVGDAKPPYGRIIDEANRAGLPMFAFDNPSGLNIETGEATKYTIKATQTVTLAVIKRGLVEPRAKDYVGKLHLVDLGIPKKAYSISGLKYPFDYIQKEATA